MSTPGDQREGKRALAAMATASEAGTSGQPAASAPSPAPGPALGRLCSPALQGFLALAFYLAVWVPAETLPLVLHPARAQLDQRSPDPNFYVWSMRWWPYAITHGLNPMYTTMVRAPHGIGLAWITTCPPLALLVSPITAVAGPVASFNLLVAVALPVSAWAAFVLCRRITGRFWAALAGGAVYGFSAYGTSHLHAGQLNLAVSLLLPLIAWLMVLWWEQKISDRVLTGLLALALALQLYLFVETFADLTVVLAAALLAGYFLAGRTDRPAVARLILLTIVAYLIAVVVAAPDLYAMLSHVPRGFMRSPAKWSLDLASLVRPAHDHAFGLTWLTTTRRGYQYWAWSKGGYVGIPLLAIAVAGIALGWQRKITRLLAAMLVFVIAAALGPTLKIDGHVVSRLPWGDLWSLPLASSAYPSRLMAFAFLALAVMTAIWLASPSKRLWARWMLALFAVAVIVANIQPMILTTQPAPSAFAASGQYHRDLARGSIIVVVSSRTGNAGLLFQAETDFYTRLAGGFLNAAVAHRSSLPLPVARLARGRLTAGKISRFRSFIRTTRASILVEAGSPRWWQDVLTRLGLTRRAIDGGELYRMPRHPVTRQSPTASGGG